MNADKLRRRLTAVRRKLLVSIAGTGAALVLIAVVSLLSIGMVVDWIGELPWLGRAALLAVNLGLIALIARRQLVVPVRTAPDKEGTALLVEQAHPEFQTRLIASVQLTRPGAVTHSDSAAMVRVLVAQAEALAERVDFAKVVSLRQAVVCVVMAALVLAAATLTFVAGKPTTAVLLRRALLSQEPVPHKTKTTVLTGNRKVAQGATVVIEAQASGVIPARGKVELRFADGRRQQFPIVPAAGRFAQTIDNVQETFTYTVRLNDDTSAEFRVVVVERPVVTGIECQQVFPAYTRLGTVPCAASDLKLLAGSRLQVNLTANKNIAQASLRLAGTNLEVPLRVDRKRLTGAIVIPQGGLTGFTVQMRDEDGIPAKELTQYRIEILPDKPPALTVTAPARREELFTRRATAVIGFEARDDFGVARVTLHYRTGKEQTIEFDLAGGTPRSLRRRYEWPLASLNESLPADTAIECWLEARDTNDITGPGITQTEHFWLRIVSEEDKRADLLNRLDDTLSHLSNIAEEQERLNQSLGALIFGSPK